MNVWNSSVSSLFVVVMMPLLWGCATGQVEIEPPSAEFVQQADEHDLAYQFASTSVGGMPALEVTMQLQTGDASHTELRVPHSWANIRDYDGIVGLQLIGDEGGRLVETDDPEIVRVEHEPHARLTVGYVVVPTYEQLDHSTHRLPTIDEEHFVALGRGILVIPSRDEELVRDILLDWSELPASWEVANSMGVDERTQSLQTSVAVLLGQSFAGGSYHRISDEHNGVPVEFLIHDNWVDSIEEFTGTVHQLKSAGTDLFGDHAHDFMLVTVHPLDVEQPESYGLAGQNSVQLWLGHDAELDSKWPLLLTSHEVVHIWNGQTLHPPFEASSEYTWFSEGVTDYYAARLLIREGLIDLEEYLRIRNQQLFEYEVSPHHTASNDELAQLRWQDADARRLPYLRGAILAMTWDTSIRQATDKKVSLDDVMMQLFEQTRENDSKLTWQLLNEVLEPLWADGPQEVDNLVRSGEELIPHHQALGPCVEPAVSKAGPYNPGFDIDGSADAGEIRGVVDGGAAYEAGLRNGHRLRSWEVYTPGRQEIAMDHFEIVHYTADGTKRRVRFLPTDDPQRVRQFGLDDDRYDEDPDACMEWFNTY